MLVSLISPFGGEGALHKSAEKSPEIERRRRKKWDASRPGREERKELSLRAKT